MTQLASRFEKSEESSVNISSRAYSLDIVSLSKKFRRQTLNKGGYSTLKSQLLQLFSAKKDEKRRVTHAIKDLTLRIPRGASVGIIGRNGSGKSTLLKLISGIYKADSGSISVNGRVAALIELGAGFHPDFSGRENLYLGGIMHGLSRKEIDRRFDQIVEFSELADFIDDPVRTYSSGMFMRLGFSLAIHTDPDILMVDEVLAVGDAAFVAKCKDKIADLRRQGKTLLLVTHDLEAVERWCDEALWLDKGQVKDRGDPRRVIDHYRQYLEKGEEQQILAAAGSSENLKETTSQPASEQQGRWGSREIEIIDVRLSGSNEPAQRVFHPDQSMLIEFDYKLREKSSGVVFGVAIHRADGLLVHGSNTEIERIKFPELGTRGTVAYQIERLGLLEGSYYLDVAAHRVDGYPFDYHKGAVNFKVRSSFNQVGIYEPQHSWKVSVV